MSPSAQFQSQELENITNNLGTVGTAEKSVLPTADAVTNMSRIGKEADQMASAPIVVNNTNNQSAPDNSAGQDNMLAVMTEPTVRLAKSSSLVRAQDRRFL